ncbi:MAG: prenyltransferase/squalene oxidase repeat-containing protein [Planctomycetota bacterium]|jgi:squalene-hopene/tetraprenyl-beta-curcumene cyclase
MTRVLLSLALILALGLGACGGDDGAKQERGARVGGPALPAYDSGLDFLRARAEAEDPSFQSPGLTALATTAFLARPGGVRDEDREFVTSRLDYIAGFAKKDGGIYAERLANYTTCASVMALAAAGEERYDATLTKAVAFIRTLQAASGGIGYSDKNPGKPDLSNTQFAIESLRAAGVPKEDATFSEALKFLQSVQNRSESNPATYKLDDGRIVAIADDGGAFYKPGESKAGVRELPDGRVQFRSYGSMTYALLKCYLLAGLPAEDPRVQAAVRWISKNFTVDENPGFEVSKDPKAAQQGYYYYLFTMAKALSLLGEKTITDADGTEHDWRAELREALVSRQKEDGSWVNEEEERWMEGNPVLATSYALIALSYSTE